MRFKKPQVRYADTPQPATPYQAAGQTAASEAPAGAAAAQPSEQPAWAKRLQRRQQLTHAATTTAHTLRGGDGGTSSQGPSLRDD